MASPFCRDCGKLVEWHPTASGKRMPIDPDPHADGTFYFGEGMKLVRGKPGVRQRMYRCHFDTCEKRGQAARREAVGCDQTGCNRTDRHSHCFKCGDTGHYARDCEEGL